jgi:hypothetical protein
MALLVMLDSDIDTHDISDIINSTFGNKCLVVRKITTLDDKTYVIETYRGKGREKMDNLIEQLSLNNIGQTFMYETELDYIKYMIKLHV